LAISLVLVLLVSKIMGHGKLMGRVERRQYNFIPMALYTMNLMMFALVNLTHAYYVAGGIGLLIVGLLAFVVLRDEDAKLPPLKWRKLLAEPED
jgi:hypothetical protein